MKLISPSSVVVERIPIFHDGSLFHINGRHTLSKCVIDFEDDLYVVGEKITELLFNDGLPSGSFWRCVGVLPIESIIEIDQTLVTCMLDNFELIKPEDD